MVESGAWPRVKGWRLPCARARCLLVLSSPFGFGKGSMFPLFPRSIELTTPGSSPGAFFPFPLPVFDLGWLPALLDFAGGRFSYRRIRAGDPLFSALQGLGPFRPDNVAGSAPRPIFRNVHLSNSLNARHLRLLSFLTSTGGPDAMSAFA